MEKVRLTKKQIDEFQKYIFSWWKKNARDLPWRHTSDPYKILVSEVILQQTQVSRGLPKYETFLQRFPDVAHLAQASTADVIREWKGLGYNRRALYLKKAAEVIVKNHHGQFPTTKKELMELPGIGAYTASAILVFAFRNDCSMVDTNIRRIIVHFFFSDSLQKESVIEEIALSLVPKGKSWEWHQALMDYGAIELKNDIRETAKIHADIRLKKRKKNVPFIETERFLRGRIIDALREKPWKVSYCIRHMSLVYGRSPDAVTKTIMNLVKEEIVMIDKDMISLPE